MRQEASQQTPHRVTRRRSPGRSPRLRCHMEDSFWVCLAVLSGLSYRRVLPSLGRVTAFTHTRA